MIWPYQTYTRESFSLLLRRVKKFYVYVLLCEGVPFYVGKGKRDVAYQCQVRALEHERKADAGKDSDMFAHIRKLKRSGKSIQYGLALHCNDESLALFHEQVEIQQFGRRCDGGMLFNRAVGGQGLHGYVASKETRLKMSITRTGRKQSALHNRAISLGRKRSVKVALENERRKIPVIVEGQRFSSVTDASAELGISKATIHYRLDVGREGYKRNT